MYPNMYIVLVGPSGSRKGTAMSPGLRFLREMGVKVAAESITREALIRELKTSNDSTVDVSTGDMFLHASLTVYSQELTVFIGYNNQALMADLTDWFDCRDSWTYRTKNMGTDEITGVWVNLIGATTPELLQTTLPRDAIGGGLTSRMIFVFEPKKGKVVPTPFLSPEERELGRLLLDDLQQVCAMYGEFKVTEDFIDNYIPWYVKYSEDPPIFADYRFSGYIERRPMHLLKLSMICSASRTNDRLITRADFNRALEILERTEYRMPQTFSGVGKNVNSEMLQRVMTTMSVVGTIEFGDLLAKFYQDLDKFTLEKIIEALILMEVVEPIKYSGTKKIITFKDTKGLLIK